MKATATLSSLLILPALLIFSGCNQGRVAATQNDARALTSPGQKFTSEMQTMVLPPADRVQQEMVATNRQRSFLRRIAELEVRWENSPRDGALPVQDRIHLLQADNQWLVTRLSTLKSTPGGEWFERKAEIDQKLIRMSSEIEQLGTEIHALVCTLPHPHAAPDSQALFAANQ